MQIILDLNKDVEEKVQKILQPLLLQNNCTTKKINTPTWVFIKCSTKLSKKKCGKLTGWQVQESLKKTDHRGIWWTKNKTRKIVPSTIYEVEGRK